MNAFGDGWWKLGALEVFRNVCDVHGWLQLRFFEVSALEHAARTDWKNVDVVHAHWLLVSFLSLLDHVNQLLFLPFVNRRQMIWNHLLLPILYHPFSLCALVLVVLIFYIHACVVFIVAKLVFWKLLGKWLGSFLLFGLRLVIISFSLIHLWMFKFHILSYFNLALLSCQKFMNYFLWVLPCIFALLRYDVEIFLSCRHHRQEMWCALVIWFLFLWNLRE